MKTEHLISLHEFCRGNKIEFSFVNTLNEFGLIEVTVIEATPYINQDHMKQLEKMMRLHYELDINIEGIEAISYLLDRVDNLHAELRAVKNRLGLYESE